MELPDSPRARVVRKRFPNRRIVVDEPPSDDDDGSESSFDDAPRDGMHSPASYSRELDEPRSMTDNPGADSPIASIEDRRSRRLRQEHGRFVFYANENEDPHYDEEATDDPLHFYRSHGITADTPEPRYLEFDADMRRIDYKRNGELPLVRFTRMLQSSGYGEVTSLQGHIFGDLDNEIHPVFQQSAWIREVRFGENHENEDDALWRCMKPGLRLATKYITDPKVMGWWVRILFSKQTRDPKSGRIYLPDPGDMGEYGISRVAKRLQSLTKRVRFQFCDFVDNGSHTHGMIAPSLYSLDQQSIPPAGGLPRAAHTEPPRALHIGINNEFRSFWLKDERDKSPGAILRLDWFFALSIVHELAHAFYQSKCNQPQPKFVEPWFDIRDDLRELGWSWEKSLFGAGEMQAFVHKTHGLIGLHWGPFLENPGGPTQLYDNQTGMRLPLSPHWIHSFFLKETWEKLQHATKAEQAVFWHPPPTTVGLYRDGWEGDWIWRSNEYPDHHPWSLNYWHREFVDIWKKSKVAGEIKRVRNKAEEDDPDYNPRARKSIRRAKSVKKA